MPLASWLQLVLFAGALALCVWPLGHYMAWVFAPTRRSPLHQTLDGWERRLLRLAGVDADAEMTWQEYARAVLIFSAISFAAVYLLQRLQFALPLNPAGLGAVSPDSAFNTSISFVSNTNWQGYAGETTMSYLTQSAALTVQNFLSAGVGLAVLIALVRGLVREESTTLGNFWVDLTRGVLLILLPLSTLLALILVAEGVPQTFGPAVTTERRLHVAGSAESGPASSENAPTDQQTLSLGPVASQEAIKQLGTNGGGFFNTNSAHPFENPTPVTNFLELLSILVIPASLCVTFGQLVRDARQGWALLAAMASLFVPLTLLVCLAEQHGNPIFTAAGVDQATSLLQGGGNMEGKEVRFGIANSALWAVATTAASNGSVNAMHDSFTPLGGLVPMWLMQLGEVIFGGVGSGLYGLLVFVILTVFIAGLMVGRTPEYLGKKIGAYEMKMAALVILLPCATVILGTALAVATEAGRAGIMNPGPHGFSEVLYALSSAANNNGSAFAGLSANTPFYNGLLGLAMLIGRFWVILPVLAMAGSLGRQKSVPPGPGTLPTHTPLFVGLLVAIVVIVGALSFFPALALGPIVEHLLLFAP
ncbi:MAG: potassium-transporting ATPase subunit KdpA [Pirellulales bacterium]